MAARRGCAMLAVLVALATRLTAAAADVRMEGSERVFPIARVVATELSDRYKIEVESSDSSAGIAALISGAVDIAMHNRSISSAEFQVAENSGLEVRSYQIGWDAVAVSGHA
jgi:ABC-type phosphate transport system substrate-binding protein